MMQPQFSDYPTHVMALIQAAVAAVNPATAVQQALKFNGRSLIIGPDPIVHTHYPGDGRIYLISVGKAALPMAQAAAQVLGDYLTGGVVIAKRGLPDAPPAWTHERLTLFLAGHPIPDLESVRAGTAVADLLSQTAPHDLLLCLISGGASALLTQPLMALDHWQKLTQALLDSGCTIHELNIIRRHLDRLKGGGLAQMAAPATCVSLILSDVVGNSLEAIGSGPTVPAPDTLADVVSVLARYKIGHRLSADTWQQVVSALRSLKDRPPLSLPRVLHLIVGDVRQAARAALVRAVQLGFSPQILTAQLEGEAREVGRMAAALAKDAFPATCLILGGETTVTVRGSGQGGRNLEVALAAAAALAGLSNRVVVSFATDGEDSLTGVAGAMVRGQTAVYGRRHRLDPWLYLDNNDSFTYFQQLAAIQTTTPPAAAAIAPCLIHTGPTGTNVNDLIFILTYGNT